jgi:metal-dependent amidase/aminoacylase/carboxypeptidase family protein
MGKDKIRIRTRASLGADDFSYFCHDSRALYYNLGTAREGEEFTAPIHNENFYPDEEAIRTGILSEVTAVLRILEEESKNW